MRGGAYAIIDGQHRATAALSIGIKSVPCQVILATQAEQAAAFSAINGNTTRISALQIHKAAVAAGDPEAVQLERLATSAGVRILRYPRSELEQEPGETMAVETLRAALRLHGEETVGLALASLNCGRNHIKGGLSAAIVRAVIDLVADLRLRDADPPHITQFIGETLMIREMDKACRDNVAPGTSRAAALKGRLLKLWKQWSETPRR